MHQSHGIGCGSDSGRLRCGGHGAIGILNSSSRSCTLSCQFASRSSSSSTSSAQPNSVVAADVVGWIQTLHVVVVVVEVPVAGIVRVGIM